MKAASLGWAVLSMVVSGCMASIDIPYDLSLTSRSAIFEQCTPVDLLATKTAFSTIRIPVSASRGSVHASFEDCVRGRTTTTISVGAGKEFVRVYYRGTAVGLDLLAFTPPTGIARSGEIQVEEEHFFSGTGFNGAVNSMAVDVANGSKLYVSGGFSSYDGATAPGLIRLFSNGSIDPSFEVGSGLDSHANTIRVVNDGSGRIYLGGNFTTYNGSPANNILRLLPDGRIDPTFDPTQILSGGVQRVALLEDGTERLYVCGNFTTISGQTSNRLARLRRDGTFDPDFSVGAGLSGPCNGLAIVPGGSAEVYMAGFTSYNGVSRRGILRLLPNGQVSTSFNSGAGSNAFTYGVTVATDGSERVMGFASSAATTFDGVSIPSGLFLIKPDGTYDSTVNIGTGIPSGAIFDAVQDLDGNFYAAGNFTSLNGVSTSRLARLFPNGQVDSAFSAGGGFDNASYLPVVPYDGTNKVYFIGPFTTYRGVNRGGIVRLNPDGSVDE